MAAVPSSPAAGGGPWAAPIGEMLPLAIGIAISPLAIVAVILILTTPQARTNGPAFLGGWLLGLAVVGGVALVVTDAAESAGTSGPRTIVAVLKIVLGVTLLVLAWRGFRSRPEPGEDAPLPKWMAALDRFTPGRSLSVGALFGGVKPKNLILAAAAAAGIAGPAWAAHSRSSSCCSSSSSPASGSSPRSRSTSSWAMSGRRACSTAGRRGCRPTTPR